MKSLIPPVQITDSRDKLNPDQIPPVDTSWTWKITGIIAALILVLAVPYMIWRRYDWVFQNTLNESERNFALFMTHFATVLPVIILAAIIFTFVRYMGARTKREKLINLYHTQGTIDMLDKNPVLMNQLAVLLMEVEKTRAGTVVAPQALNYAPADSHNTANTEKNATANIDTSKMPIDLPMLDL